MHPGLVHGVTQNPKVAQRNKNALDSLGQIHVVTPFQLLTCALKDETREMTPFLEVENGDFVRFLLIIRVFVFVKSEHGGKEN